MDICTDNECPDFNEDEGNNCEQYKLVNACNSPCYLKEEAAPMSSPFSEGLCAMHKEITEEITRLQSFIKEPSFSEEEKHTKDLCQAQIPAYKHCLDLLIRISA